MGVIGEAMTEQIQDTSLDININAMRRADRAQERMVEQNTPEPKRIQCAHCKDYYFEEELEHKAMCYACKENLDDYRRVMNQRNLFLQYIRNIRSITDFETIKAMCDGILAQYKEE